jgi:cysteine synthase A
VRTLLGQVRNSFWPNQYANPCNALGHRQTLAEVVRDLGAAPDYLFVAVSTCGTLRGCAEYAREHGLPTRLVAVDALGSVIFGRPKGPRLLAGHGAGVRPALFQPGLAWRCVHVSDRECVAGCRRLVRREGILAGASSGGVVAALDRLRPEVPAGTTCVLILCDRGEHYLGTVYADDWVRAHFGAIPDLEDLERGEPA